MYQLNNQLPAPYELQHPAQGQPMPTQPAQSFAKGGRTKGMVAVHMNPQELHILDHLQDKVERCPKTNLRSYPGIEALLKNSHIVAQVHHHARAHHAAGGLTPHYSAGGLTPHYDHGGSLDHMAADGRHGDTEMALIGPHTHHLFDQLAGHKTRNPHDGHPEYFSLGGMLGGLWNTVKGVGSKLLPAVLPMAQQFLGGKGKIGQLASGALGMAAPHLQGMADRAGAGNPIGQAIGSGLSRMAQSRGQGNSWGQAAGHGMAETGRGFGGAPIGAAMQGMGESMGRGESPMQAMRHGAGRGFNQMGGASGVADMARNIMSRRGEGMRGMGRAAMQEGRGMMPNRAGIERQNLWDQYNDMDNF